MSNKIYKCAVIGCGFISGEHINAYINSKNSELTALCDTDAQWLEYAKKKYNVKYAYTDYRKLLENPEIDAVSVCVPNKYHAEITIAALEAGKHVLCEKPMAACAADARKMIEAKNRSGKKLMIVQNQRFIPAAQVMKEMNARGEFGQIYHIRTGWRRPMGMMPSPEDKRENGQITNRNWYNEKESSGGVLRDLGVHLLDLAMYITGFPKVTSAAASGYREFKPNMTGQQESKYKFSSEDFVCALINFDNGMSLSLELSFGSAISEEALFTVLYGTKGGAERCKDELRLIKTDDTFAYTVEQADFSGTKEFISCAHEFIDVLVNDREVPVTPEQCLSVIETLDKIYEAMDKTK